MQITGHPAGPTLEVTVDSSRPDSPATGTAGTTTTTDTTTGISGIRTVAVPVTDQDRALAFYVDRLGLQVRMDEPVAQLAGRWIEVCPPGTAVSLALVPAGPGTPSGVATGVRLTSPDAAALHARLRESGAAVEDLLQWPGVPPMFTLRDPDGNGLQVVQEG